MRGLVALVLVVAACGGKAAPVSAPAVPPEVVGTAAPPAAPPSTLTPPGLRLGDDVTPTRYDLDLVVEPKQSGTQGKIEIAIKVNKPTAAVWLHAKDLVLSDIRFTASDGKVFTATAGPTADEMASLAFAQPLPTGNGVLSMQFRGKIVEDSDSGLFRQKEGNEWYAFTQFETSAARNVFPCFDEPRWRTPFRLSVRTPPENLAFSNTALEVERVKGPHKVYVFAETKPLPTYLLALAVGPFDVVTVDEGAPRHPTRIIVPRGHAKGTSYARAVAAPILHTAEDYFGIPYPFEKVDLVAIPTLSSFSAMEHPGMITFRMGLLTQADDDWTLPEKRRTAGIMAHEYAHQWFGNFVTPVWWNDIWLNEGFASWMGNKMMKKFAPDWDVDTSAVAERIEAMGTDALAASRKVRQEIKGGDDIANAFDRISYAKGLALLAMFEAWAGEEPFRRGIRRYLEAHAFGNATSDDFLAALGAETGKELPAAFATFLEQPGIPLISMDLACDKGKPPRLLLEQSRYAPVGSKAQAESWQVPVCVRWGEGKKTGRQCTLLTAAKAELVLEATRCPTWIAPNAEAAGYFHVAPSRTLLPKLTGKSGLTTRERLQLAYDLYALSRSGQLPAADALGFAMRLAGDDDRYVLEEAADIIRNLGRLVPDEQLPAFRRFVLAAFGPRARTLGWSPRKGDSEETMDVRAHVVGLAANIGEDPMLMLAARKHLDAWFDDPKAISLAVWPALSRAAVRDGDAALFDRLVAKAKQSEDRIERARILGTLGSFRDPKLAERAREMAISGEFEIREAARVLFDQVADPATRDGAWAWYRANLDRVAKRAPRGGGAYMALVGSPFCDQQRRDEFVATFEARSQKALGGPRIYSQVLERIDQCMAMRKAHAAALGKLVGGPKGKRG